MAYLSAFSEFGINDIMFKRLCRGTYSATPSGFARIYIGCLQGHVIKLEESLINERLKTKAAVDRLADKDEIIAMLKNKLENKPVS